MTKTLRKTFTLAIILFFTTLGVWISQAQADRLEIVDPVEKEQITETINAYFDARYRSFNALKLEDFGELVEGSYEGKAFLNSELEKLGIEIYHAKLFGLRYLEYRYFLDFREIHIDQLSQTASVLVVEGHDVVFEVSEPIVSSMRNRKHVLVLHREKDTWKIVSDAYEDYLWRLIMTTGQSKETILRSIDNTYNLTKYGNNSQNNSSEFEYLPSIATYPYNRDGAVSYAHRWAHDRNPNYHDFSNEGGDCTNFVSQALYEGGGSLMAFTPNPRPEIGGPGWYYASYYDRAAAWNNVGFLFNFLVNEDWDVGPSGNEVGDSDYTLIGDLIQFNWNNDETWDHSVIIVDYDDPESEYLPLVASHSEDHDRYPFTYFTYWDVRFIHIRWNRGELTYLPMVSNSDGAMSNLFENVSPYPPPVSMNSVDNPLLAYPAP